MKMCDICYAVFMFFIFFYLMRGYKKELTSVKVLAALVVFAVGYFVFAEIFIHKNIDEYVSGMITVNTARIYTAFESLVFAIVAIQANRENRFARLLILQALLLLCISDFGIRYNVMVQSVAFWPGFERLWMFAWSIIFVNSYRGISFGFGMVRPIITLRFMLAFVMLLTVSVLWLTMIKIGVAKVPTTLQLTKVMVSVYIIWCFINALTATQTELFQKVDFLLKQGIIRNNEFNSIAQHIDDKIKIFGKIL
jgi:hypothetical protein